MCPICAPGLQRRRFNRSSLHVIHAMPQPGRIEAMPSQREGHNGAGRSRPSPPLGDTLSDSPAELPLPMGTPVDVA